MNFKHHLKSFYRATVLPALRGITTPCFQLAVRIAVAVGAIPRASISPDTQECFLIVHLSSHVGDTVMLLPMIEALREAHPGARIECAVQIPMGSFLRLVPSIDVVREFDIRCGRITNPWLELWCTLAVLKIYWTAIRHVRPTTCIIPRWGCGFRDLMLAYLTQAPNRVGFASNDFDRSQPPAGYRDALLTLRVRDARQMTEPARFLFLLAKSSLITPMDRTRMLACPNSSVLHVAASVDWIVLAARVGLDPYVPLAVIAPGATAPKPWPVERWATVAGELHRDGYTVVVLAGAQDAQLAKRLYDLIPNDSQGHTVLIAGTTTLAESSCLLAHSQVFLGSDSGPGHLAGALGVPSVILFIAANGADPDCPFAPERVRPMGEHVACCRPAHTISPCVDYCTADEPHCILQIQPGDVLHALEALPDIAVQVAASRF